MSHSAPRIQVGEWSITALSDGFFRLDGGAMWGVVPANIWRPLTPPAEDNTILLALRPFLAERGDERVIIEAGAGERWEPKWRSIYHIDDSMGLERSLQALGVDPESITHVVASHCHWDHIGAQVVERDGQLEPLFPAARHFAPSVEIAMAKNPDRARAGSYRAADLLAIEERGLLEGFSGATDILPGLRATVLGGHSDGVSVITVNEDEPGETAIFWSDVVPTRHHIQPPYIMAYDIDVLRSFDVRGEWLARAADGNWIGLFYHDAEQAFGRVRRDGRRFVFEPMADADVTTAR
ncbi:MAG: glyoxylase-like metal-dependent hydrolase (beta-lactamase superfamily II) [Chlamydiales bacterium]|jgi:glyoxylase-like metal-dependent hydrolase (beta-lactamase superfamily II)